MANVENLAPSLSDEETEGLVKDPAKRTRSSSSKKQGFKFDKADLNVKDNFDFANQSANQETSSSDADEDFVHLNPNESDEANEENEGNSAPSTPAKLTPHKRAAHGTGEGAVANGPNGSPPSSPAPKKKKWEDFVAEDEAKERAKENVPTKPIDKNWYIIGVVVTAICAALLALYYSSPNPSAVVKSKPSYTWKKASANFMSMAVELESQFPNQNKGTWIQLIASISSTLKKSEPTHPACVTILFPPSMSQEFAMCLAQKVGGIVNKAVAPFFNQSKENPVPPKEINLKTFSSMSITEFRSEIASYFKHQGKAAITKNVDLFKREDLLFQFHGLCDSYLAVEKRATLLFPVQVPENIFKKYDWIHERGGDIANDVLTDAWKTTLSPDSGPALVARVADSVVVLNEGDKCAL